MAKIEAGEQSFFFSLRNTPSGVTWGVGNRGLSSVKNLAGEGPALMMRRTR